jgi:hypothetical protein
MRALPRRREGRPRWRLAIFTFAVVGMEACSLFIPFDDYPGAAPTPGNDGSLDGRSGDGGIAESCGDADTKSDPLNCGACGRRCAAEGACNAGKCPIEPASSLGGANLVDFAVAPLPATDGGDQYVYATTALSRVIRTKTSQPTGPVEVVPGGTTTGKLSVNVNGTNGVYSVDGGIAWFKSTNFATAPGKPLVDRPNIGPILLEKTLVFWGEPSGLWWRTVNATDPSPALYSNIALPAPVALDTIAPNRILWTTANGVTYETSSETPATPAMLLDGGVPDTRCMAATASLLLLCQKSQGVLVYDWNRATDAAVFKRKWTLDDPEAITTDGAYMYVLDAVGANADVRRAPLDGRGPTIILASNVSAAGRLVVAGDYIYFLDGASVMRTTK